MAALVDTYFDIRIMITSPTDTAFTRFVTSQRYQ